MDHLARRLFHDHIYSLELLFYLCPGGEARFQQVHSETLDHRSDQDHRPRRCSRLSSARRIPQGHRMGREELCAMADAVYVSCGPHQANLAGLEFNCHCKSSTRFSVRFALTPLTAVQPLFNKLTPLPAGDLRTRVEALASRLNFPLKHLYVIDGSKRSSHSNAYVLH